MADEMLPLRLFTLGAPEIRLGENRVNFSTRKTQALLIYLAVEAGQQPREHLAALLWPEASPERSHANLRNTLGHLQTALRRASGQDQTAYLDITHHALGLNPEANIDLDLHFIEQAYTQARADRASRALPQGASSLPILQMALARQRGDFLVGFSLGDAPGFDDWAAMQREVWRRRLGLVLDRLSEIQFAGGQFAGAAETASRWIALDALNEVAYRRKMRAHFAAGERGQALETYESCRAVLAAELSAEPEPDTIALAERIRTQVIAVQPQTHRSVLRPHRPDTSLAFLENLFVGRSREHQRLVTCYEHAAAGRPQFVVLRGELGIGKTRLARKFLAWASAQGAEVLQGGAFESGSHWPFQPLVQALRQWLEDENPSRDVLDETWLAPLSRLLPGLRQRSPGLSLPYPDLPTELAPPVSSQEGFDREAQVFEAFTQFTLALAQRRPLVLFVDDLQWTDSATLDLLQYALRRWQERAGQADGAGRVLLLVSLRSEALRPMTQPQPAGSTAAPLSLIGWLASMEREVAPAHLELEPLGEQETVQMVLSILELSSLEPPAAGFAQWLYAETRGHPFYLMETLKDLLERRVLHSRRQVGGQWAFALDAEHDLGQAVRVPSTVHAVIRSRLQRLSPDAFSLLAGGAVLEQQITFERLCAIANVTQDLALPALDELLSGRLLLEAAQAGAASDYAFINDMFRDVVYTEAGDARRRLFHRRALEILAAGGEPAAVLAYHAQAAGLAKEAFHYSLVAGREALRLAAANEAIVHLEHARKLAQDPAVAGNPDQADLRDLYLWLSQAYKRIGQMEKASAVAREFDIDQDL